MRGLSRKPGERRRRERRADDPVLLAHVRGGIALARTRPPRPTDVEERNGVGLRPLQPGGGGGSGTAWVLASAGGGRIGRHAPMFCGSSCAPTPSRRFG